MRSRNHMIIVTMCVLFGLLGGCIHRSDGKNLQHHRQSHHLHQHHRQRHSVMKKAPNDAQQNHEVQVEEEGYFDIVEKPEQFLEVDAQIAPSTKGNSGGKSPAHIQRILEAAAATNDDSTVKKKKSADKNLPAFLFNSDLTKIQSNARNIAIDVGKNFFYERNIIVEPTLPADKLRAEKQQKGDDSKTISKDQLRRRMAFRRRLFKQLKGKKIFGPKKHSKRKPKRDKPERNLYPITTTIPNTSIAGSDRVFNDHNRHRRAVTAKKERIWDYGVIPYEIDNIFSGTHKALFKQAMRHWENFTCIKFVERNPKEHPNYIYFTVKSCGCCSYVGKQGKGRQAISIGRNCEKFGIVVHELGHVIGFWHEHTRTDRDNYIMINKMNIIKGQEYNFDKLSPEDVDSLGLPYNYNSIMHYAKNTFSKSSYLDTIQPVGITEQEQIKIGQRVRLSSGDIVQANMLYKCPTCGKTYQQSSGKIIAPQYRNIIFSNASDDADRGSDRDFNNDSEFDKSLENCEWRISATNGERIILQIHVLSLMTSDNCSEDYLEIRDGYWYQSPVIRRLCGNTTSETIKSESSRMLLSYVNRNVVKGFRGFIADFKVICGGDIYLNDSRRIDSPNYPLEYMPDKECIWRITVPQNHQVALKFQSFELENHDNCIYDYVEVRDGGDEDSELIGIFCGYKLPPNIKTNSDRMFIKFVSDGTVQKVGFSALFMPEVDECKFGNHGCEHECVNTLGSYECDCYAGYELNANGKSCEAYACGGIIDASIPNGTITSPMFPNLYPLAKVCVWELVAPANHAVFLKFDHFDLEGTKYQYTECNYDYLVAYSKLRDSRLKKIGVYCGTEIPPMLNSLQNILRLEFSSDKSVQHTGFSAEYEIDNNECSIENGGCQHFCTNTLGSYECSCRNGFTLDEDGHNCTETKCKFEITSPYGIIYSPNYPDDYPRNIYCFWHFQTVLGHRVQLTFREFEVENHQECIYDYVAIHDGKSENGSILGIYCGGREPYAVLASANEMFMVLKTDAGLQRKGFMAAYSTECGGYLRATNRSQVFYSHPRYGSRPYGKRQYCNWRVQSDPESSVKIKFLHFEVEYSERCEYDFVEVSEDLLGGYIRTKNHGKYCGNRKPPSIVSYSDTLLIRFQSDESTSLSGFAISFIAVEPPDEDLIDDLDAVTPFPGYMKNIYLKPDLLSSTIVSNHRDDNDDDNDNDYNDDDYNDRRPKNPARDFIRLHKY